MEGMVAMAEGMDMEDLVCMRATTTDIMAADMGILSSILLISVCN